MDTETSQAFAKVLEYIVNSLGGVVEDKGSDVVEYIKTLGSEIVAYKLGIAYMWELVAIIAAIAGIIVIIVGLVKDSECAVWIGGIFIGVAVIIAIVNGYTIIECKTFPEKVILDYIENMHNNAGSSMR